MSGVRGNVVVSFPSQRAARDFQRGCLQSCRTNEWEYRATSDAERFHGAITFKGPNQIFAFALLSRFGRGADVL